MKKKLDLSKKNFFPVSMPNVTQKDIVSVNKALKAGWISSEGPEVKKFEKSSQKFPKIPQVSLEKHGLENKSRTSDF